MSETDKQDLKAEDQRDPTRDDRRGDVKPTDHPVPSSPEPDEAAVREGEEQLGRVKPY